MDWQCPSVDPRWKDSIRVITLRHPIERHFSEFFYSGLSSGFKLNMTRLYANRTYTDNVAKLINEQFPMWMKKNSANPPTKEEQRRKIKKTGKMKKSSFNPKRLLGRYYTDNFQLRSLAGCSSGECLEDHDLDGDEKDRMRQQLSALAPRDTVNCTFYFVIAAESFEVCGKKLRPECPDGCDGPCFYPTRAGGPLTPRHLDQAKRALESFDAVLLTDTLDDERQSDFLSDVLGTPRDAGFSLKFKDSKNARVDRTRRREKVRFYRDMLQKLRLHHLFEALTEENALEIELFRHAKRLNEEMIGRWEEETGGPRDASAEDAHDYAVLVVHYHKTGYVLTRLLMKLAIGLEYEGKGRSQAEIKKAKTISGYANDHVDKKTGATIAFGQRGSWNRNFFPARRHRGVDGCPDFSLEKGAIYLQEAPDFYCDDVDLAQRMLGYPEQKSGKTKIVHFVRNPFEMVLSNYFYHSQDPSPEKWVHIDDPCEYNYGNGESLASHVLPTISHKTKITQKQIDDVVTTCQSLYRSKPRLKNATFYEHLLELNHWDGLRLATAQMMIASSVANKGMAGGDVLRMGFNVVKFQNLLTSPSIPRKQRENTHLLTISMDDYIKSTKNVTLRFLDFVLGSDDAVVSNELRLKAAEEQATSMEKGNKGNHVTQGKHEDKDELRQMLRDDVMLGPILSEVEMLVNEALAQSEEVVNR